MSKNCLISPNYVKVRFYFIERILKVLVQASNVYLFFHLSYLSVRLK
jgi:hypothetical protein